LISYIQSFFRRIIDEDDCETTYLFDDGRDGL